MTKQKDDGTRPNASGSRVAASDGTPRSPLEGAPNILLILLDDVGFGASSAFGGPCQTPNIERLAARGLSYTRFHTTALREPTRQALLTGRNHHSNWSGAEVAPPIARTLELNGYSTSQFGKCDEAITWIRHQKALLPGNPFFTYFARGATHAPEEWADEYKGKFDQGWDRVREETFARQKMLGVIPQDCQLTERHADIPAWDTICAELKPVLARRMEVYAGFLAHTDHDVGQLVDALEELGILDDTLIYVIVGDNGASAEGAVGWAHAMRTPYQWTNQVASHFGGTRNGLVVHWPGGIKAKGELRHQFHHVIDFAATALEVAGLPHPLMVDGVTQRPLEGVSMAYSFDDAKAADRHETQHFEMQGNRGIYQKGWTAVTKHDVWELYDTTKDWSQSKDLAKEQPAILHELQRLWLIEAAKYNVLAGRPELVKDTRRVAKDADHVVSLEDGLRVAMAIQ